MAKKKLQHVNRRLTEEERARHARIREAALAKIPNQATIRDIEQGRDVKLSNLQSVADALGLKLEVVEQAR